MPPRRESVLGMNLDVVSYGDVVESIDFWCRQPGSRYVCVANVHMVMEAWDSPGVRAAVNAADLVVPDGVPLVWTLQRRGIKISCTVRGATLVLRLCEWAAQNNMPVGFLGGAPGVADAAAENLQYQYPNLQVVYRCSPPYFSEIEWQKELAREINDSGARILFIGLGCPKQELWMAAHAELIQATMIGVGQAFDIHAGTIREAPELLRSHGLEWLFRLAIEPRRLWKRYLKHNPRFVVHAIREHFRLAQGNGKSR